MKKNVLLFIILFLLTGCSVNYDLTIGKNLQVTEDVVVQSDSSLFKYYYDDNKADVINTMLDNEPNYKNNYDIEIKEDSEYPSLVTKKSYSSLDDFINNSILIREYFNKVDYELKDGILTFRATEFLGKDNDNQEKHNIDFCKINIKTDYDVIESNTSSINFGNTHTWSINKNVNDLNIYMKIDTNKKYYQVEYFWIKVVGLFVVIMIGFSIIKSEKKRKSIYKKVDEDDFDDIDLV